MAAECFCEFGGCVELKFACGAFASLDAADNVDVNTCGVGELLLGEVCFFAEAVKRIVECSVPGFSEDFVDLFDFSGFKNCFFI